MLSAKPSATFLEYAEKKTLKTKVVCEYLHVFSFHISFKSPDIDECQMGVCRQQMCRNTLGGYLCGCGSGYKQAADGSCHGNA